MTVAVGAFSKIKALLKKAAARTREAQIEEIGRALSALTMRDVRICLSDLSSFVDAALSFDSEPRVCTGDNAAQ